MAFHFWDTSAVVRDLSIENVSESDAVKYAVATGLSWSLAHYIALWIGVDRSWALVYEFLVVLVVTAFGTYECYRANGGPDGKNFLRNFFCIAWPVGFKLFLLGWVIGIQMYYGFPTWVGTTFRDPAFAYTALSLFLSASLAVAYYWRISVHLTRLQTQIRSNSPFESQRSTSVVQLEK